VARTPEEILHDAGVPFRVHDWPRAGRVCPLADGATVLVDRQVLALERAFCGSGRNDATLEVSPAGLVAAAGATLTELARPG
jgi:prolyl-tRNA editing enzyme YbaK/EbsC (Cys-tRNA(Pro) deacylase)